MAQKRKSSNEEQQGRAMAHTGAKTSLDIEALRSMVELLEASDVTHLSWRRGEERLVIRRGQTSHTHTHTIPAPASSSTPSVTVTSSSGRANAGPLAQSVAPTAPEKSGLLVSSPFVGTFYRTPAPDQPSFVEMGSVVKKGQVLCIVEAMKLMNEIEAEAAGTIIEILAQNGQAVEFGQALFRIEPL